MATIERRNGTYRVKVRRKGAPPLTATSTHLAEAKKWAHMTESAILEGRHFTATEAQRHTLTDLVDRYICEVLPQKCPSTVPAQTRQLPWWKTQLVQPGRNNDPLELPEVAASMQRTNSLEKGILFSARLY